MPKVEKPKAPKAETKAKEREVLYPEIAVESCVGPTAMSAERVKEKTVTVFTGGNRLRKTLYRLDPEKRVMVWFGGDHRGVIMSVEDCSSFFTCAKKERSSISVSPSRRGPSNAEGTQIARL